jgi:hypothetical protein
MNAHVKPPLKTGDKVRVLHTDWPSLIPVGAIATVAQAFGAGALLTYSGHGPLTFLPHEYVLVDTSRTVKVGDKVVAKSNMLDLTAGKTYTVDRLHRDSIIVRDDVGDQRLLAPSEYDPAPVAIGIAPSKLKVGDKVRVVLTEPDFTKRQLGVGDVGTIARIMHNTSASTGGPLAIYIGSDDRHYYTERELAPWVADDTKWQDAAKAGQKIEAIKAYRKEYDIGLKEAKDAVEAWLAKQPKFKVGDRIRGAAVASGKVGTIVEGFVIQTDVTDVPYLIRTDSGACHWLRAIGAELASAAKFKVGDKVVQAGGGISLVDHWNRYWRKAGDEPFDCFHVVRTYGNMVMYNAKAGANNGPMVPEKDLALYVAPVATAAPKFKVGDKVRSGVNGATGYTVIAGDGDIVTVSHPTAWGGISKRFHQSTFVLDTSAVGVEPKFKVGDRVRFKADGASEFISLRGKTATIVGPNNGNLRRYEWSVKLEERFVLGHNCKGLAPEGFGLWVRSADIELAPATAPTKPALSGPTLGDILASALGRKPKLPASGEAIVCLIENGQPQPSLRPFVHDDTDSAINEAKRLTRKHKGKQFGVYELTALID